METEAAAARWRNTDDNCGGNGAMIEMETSVAACYSNDGDGGRTGTMMMAAAAARHRND